MKYTININQAAAYVLGMQNKLFFNDLAIFDFMWSFSKSKSIRKIEEGNTIYYLFSWKLIVKQLPMLGISTRQGIKRRIDKLIKSGIIEAHPDNSKNGASYFCFTELAERMYFINEIDLQQMLHPDNKCYRGDNKCLRGGDNKCYRGDNKCLHYNNDNYNNDNLDNKDNNNLEQNSEILHTQSLDFNFEKEEQYEASERQPQNCDYLHKMPKKLKDLCLSERLNKLKEFENQPKASWLGEKIASMGENFVFDVMRSINAYCEKNKFYTSKRKSLALVFNHFAKSHDTEKVSKAKKVFSNEYEKTYFEPYEFASKDGMKIQELLDKIEKSLNRLMETPPTETNILDAFKYFMKHLPESRRTAKQFTPALVNYSYQAIKNEIKTSGYGKAKVKNNVKNGKKGFKTLIPDHFNEGIGESTSNNQTPF